MPGRVAALPLPSKLSLVASSLINSVPASIFHSKLSGSVRQIAHSSIIFIGEPFATDRAQQVPKEERTIQ